MLMQSKAVLPFMTHLKNAQQNTPGNRRCKPMTGRLFIQKLKWAAKRPLPNRYTF